MCSTRQASVQLYYILGDGCSRSVDVHTLNHNPFAPLSAAPVVIPSQRSMAISPAALALDCTDDPSVTSSGPSLSVDVTPAKQRRSKGTRGKGVRSKRAQNKGSGVSSATAVACFFCRGRHIRCGGPAAGSSKCMYVSHLCEYICDVRNADRLVVRPCLQRSQVCDFPEESRRGQRPRKSPAQVEAAGSAAPM